MLLKQEFASSSFYYSISHEFFIAQAPDPADAYAWVKQHSAERAYCLSETACLQHGKLQEHVAYVEIFSCLRVWDLQLLTTKRSLAVAVMSFSAQNHGIILRCQAEHPEDKSFLKIMSKCFNILQIW